MVTKLDSFGAAGGRFVINAASWLRLHGKETANFVDLDQAVVFPAL